KRTTRSSMDASAPPIAAVPPDDPVASYLEKYGQDPVSSYLEKYGPKPTAPVLKPLRVPMASADATSIYQPRRPSEPATIPERTPLIQSPRDVTATVASPQSAPIAPPDAQALRADLFRQSPLGEVDAQVPNLIAGAAQFPADVITHPIASAYRAVTAPVRAVKAAFQTGEAVSKSVHDTGAPAPPFQESAENLIGSSMDVAALTMPVIRGAGALADASTADAVEGARSAVTAPSTPSLAPEGPKDMHAGIPPLPKGALNDLSTAAKEALTDVYAPIRDRAPELHEALHSAGAMPPVSAGRFVGGLVDRSLRDLTPEQQDVFGKRILLDNLEAEAERKTTAAADAATQAQAEQAKAEQPSKSARDLWYSRTTPGGALRAPAEMETDPLIDELARRAEASKVYHADARRFGPTSAVTMRNEAQIGNIEGILQERDGLHPDDIWREVARRNEVAHANGEDFDFGASAGEHGEPLDIDQHLPTAPVTETGARARMLSEAAQNFTARADALRTQLPANVESEPWFQQALDRAKMNVQGFNEAGAVGAGVDPSTFRRPSLGLYMRLLSQDRVNEQNIRNAQATAERNPGATEPRTGVAKLILGQARCRAAHAEGCRCARAGTGIHRTREATDPEPAARHGRVCVEAHGDRIGARVRLGFPSGGGGGRAGQGREDAEERGLRRHREDPERGTRPRGKRAGREARHHIQRPASVGRSAARGKGYSGWVPALRGAHRSRERSRSVPAAGPRTDGPPEGAEEDRRCGHALRVAEPVGRLWTRPDARLDGWHGDSRRRRCSGSDCERGAVGEGGVDAGALQGRRLR